MSRKKILAFAMAFAMSAALVLPTLKAEAVGLAQASDASSVNYGSVSQADIQILRGLFDVEYYKAQNPDLVAVFGNDTEALFNHFCTCGVFEGRTCNAAFDPSAYASAYEDLKTAFGSDIIKYYEHFAAFSASENRTITNIAAAASAGITVQSLVDSSVKITPQVYYVAQALGTNDYKTVAAAISSAAAGNTVAVASSSTAVITEEEIDPVLAEAMGLTQVTVDTISYADATDDGYGNQHVELHIYIVKGNKGYAAYAGDPETIWDESTNAVQVYKTSDYEGVTDEDGNPVTWLPIIAEFGVTATYLNEEESTSWVDIGGGYAAYCTADGDPLDVTTESTAEKKVDEGDEGDYVYYSDENATNDTEYTYSMSIEEKDDDTITVNIGIYNEDNEFAYVASFDSPSELAPDEETVSDDSGDDAEASNDADALDGDNNDNN